MMRIREYGSTLAMRLRAIGVMLDDPDAQVRAYAITLVGRWVHKLGEAEAAILGIKPGSRPLVQLEPTDAETRDADDDVLIALARSNGAELVRWWRVRGRLRVARAGHPRTGGPEGRRCHPVETAAYLEEVAAEVGEPSGRQRTHAGTIARRIRGRGLGQAG